MRERVGWLGLTDMIQGSVEVVIEMMDTGKLEVGGERERRGENLARETNLLAKK